MPERSAGRHRRSGRRRERARARAPRLAVLLSLCAAACGNADTLPPNDPNATFVTILNYQFSPPNLSVPPGGTVVVWSDETQPLVHELTSASGMNTFTHGSVAGVDFDTGPLSPNDRRNITIPAGTPIGTVVPFFCLLHGSVDNQGMEGTITVVAPP